MHTAIFFRDDFFYPIEFLAPEKCGMTMEQQAASHAECNPGTLRVEDANGNLLWRPQ